MLESFYRDEQRKRLRRRPFLCNSIPAWEQQAGSNLQPLTDTTNDVPSTKVRKICDTTKSIAGGLPPARLESWGYVLGFLDTPSEKQTEPAVRGLSG